MDDRGFASGFVVLIITIFVLLVGYIATMTAYDKLRNEAVNTANNLSNEGFAQDILDVLSWADTIYIKVPLMILFGLLIYAVLNAMRREPRTFQR